MAAQPPKGLAAVEVDDDDPPGARDRGVRDVGDPCLALAEVEADIVQVGLEAAISVGKRMVLTTWLVARWRRRAWGRWDGVPRHPATMRKLTPRRLPLLRPLRQERRPL